MPRPRRANPWISRSEIVIWLLFFGLLIPAGFAGWAIGHYTSLGKPPSVVTVTVGSTATSTTTSTPTTTSSTTTGSNSAAVAAGKGVFAANGCGACHTFTPAGSNGTIGPNLDTAIAPDAKADGKPLPAFILESITNPKAYLAKGYTTSVMPTTFGTLPATQLHNLVAFILSGTSSS